MKKTRVELYEMVWQTPMIHLATQLNVSDAGLKKICRKHSIPLPARGHWIRKQHGKIDPQPELPYSDHNPVISFPNDQQAEHNKSIGKLIRTAKHQHQVEPITRTIEQLKDIRCIRTAEAIKAFIKKLEEKSGQTYDAVKDKPSKWPPTNIFTFAYFSSAEDQIPIAATAKQALRAVCIADVIIEKLTQLGISVVFEPRRNQRRYEMKAQKGRADYEIEFYEPWSKATRSPSLTKLEKLATGYEGGSDSLEAPTSVLSILLGSRYAKKTYRDTAYRLEYQIDKVIDHIVWKLDDEIRSREESDASEREYERKKAIRRHNEQIVEDQDKQYEIALKESERFVSHQRLKDYLLVVQDAVARLPEQKQVIGKHWLRLVRAKMDTNNPINKRLKQFKSLQKLGAEKSDQYWHEAMIPEKYDPEFEANLRDEQDL